MIEGLTEEQIKHLVPTITKQRFIRAIQKHFPDETMDFTIGEDGEFADAKALQFWKLYCQGKEDQAWYSPAGHIVARVTPMGIQLAKTARIIRHTKQINKIIAGLRRRHGGEYVTLSIIGADIQRLKRWMQMEPTAQLDNFQVRVVNHDKTTEIEPKKENGVDGSSVNPQHQ